MRRNWLLSIGAVVLAFLGTQHHNLMMLLVAAGVSNAGLNLMASLPLLRDAMLLMSLLMAAVIAYQITRPKRPALMRVGGIVSILLTLGIAGWSFMHGAH